MPDVRQTTRHTLCGIPLTWRSVFDDRLEPCMVPWCPECAAPIPNEQMDGDIAGIVVDVEQLAAHTSLVALADAVRSIQ
jgi:hypothetical protein